MYKRMVDKGTVKNVPPHIEVALDKINDLQQSYQWDIYMWDEPKGVEGVAKGSWGKRIITMPGHYYDIEQGAVKEGMSQDPFNFMKQYSHYCAIAYQKYGEAIFTSSATKMFGPFKPWKSRWQFASKIFAIRSVEEHAKKILNEIIKIEFQEVTREFAVRNYRYTKIFINY